MKKKEMARKMRKSDNGNVKRIVEGDAAAHLGPQDKFTRKDVSKEKFVRREKEKGKPEFIN